MKRLTCKPEFVPKILAGSKCCTCRAKDKHLQKGDIVALVTKTGKTPAFLVKAEDAFAYARIVDSMHLPVAEIGREVIYPYHFFGFDTPQEAVEFYLRSLKDAKSVFVYEWQLITKAEAMKELGCGGRI